MGLFNKRNEVNIVQSALPQANSNQAQEVVHREATDRSLYDNGEGMGGGTQYWYRSDDTLNQKDDNIRRAIKEFAKAWRFTHLTPLETLAENPMQFIRPNPNDAGKVGYDAVIYWLSLFEADNRQATGHLISQHLSEYYRGFGEIFTEQRFIIDPLLKSIGFKAGYMLKRIDLIAPWHVPRDSDSVVKDSNGNWKQLKMTTLDGSDITVEPPEVNRFVHLTNRPGPELRGISYILSLLRPFGEEYDLRRVAFDSFDNYTRPLEWYKIHRNPPQGGPRLIDEAWRTTRDNIKSQVMGNRGRVRKAIYTDEYVEPNMIGSNQKMIDPTPALKTMSKENDKSAMLANFFQGEDVNRATMFEIRRAFHRIHAQGIDYNIVKRFWERNIFPIVLQSMNIDPRLAPVIMFPKFNIPEERLQTAQADLIEAKVFGNARRQEIAEERGIKYGDDYEVEVDGVEAAFLMNNQYGV